VDNITVSVYDRLRTRNRCNHRDYQNLGVNGYSTHLLNMGHFPLVCQCPVENLVESRFSTRF